MRFSLALTVALIALVSVGLTRLAAQDASPEAGPITTGATPEVPNATLCTVEPRTIENLQQVASAAAAGAATPVSSPVAEETPFVLPQGSAADADAIARVTATVREAVACRNAGDSLRYFALHTDSYLTRFFSQAPLSQEQLDAFAAPPTPLDPTAQVGLIAVQDVRLLADGRIAVLIRQIDPSALTVGPQRVFFVMVEQGGRYLIDEEIIPDNPEGAGTPAA